MNKVLRLRPFVQ